MVEKLALKLRKLYMKAKIFIKYKEGILDPQGMVTGNALRSIGIKNIKSIGIGKFIELNFGKKITKDKRFEDLKPGEWD